MSNTDQNVELPELEEAQKAPVGDEEQSVASVDKAGDATSQAPSRKGDQKNKDEPAGRPKTKSGMINAMFTKMSGMSKAEMSKMFDSYMEDVEADEDAVELPEFTYTDELDTMIESEATLSDEFKAKSAVLFETAVKSKLSEEIERMEDEFQSRLEEELDATRSDLVEKIDSYLNYVVENWMEENKVAIQTGLRTEIAEDFMNKMKDLFTESYIDVPESKIDLVDELAETVEELEEKLNAQTGKAIEMAEELESYKRDAIIREASRDLVETQVEKLKSLVDDIDFDDEETFAKKVATVKESYFNKVTSTESADFDTDEGDDAIVESSGSMAQYLTALKRTQ